MERAYAEARLGVLHLEMPSGKVLKGLYANVIAWEHSEGPIPAWMAVDKRGAR